MRTWSSGILQLPWRVLKASARVSINSHSCVPFAYNLTRTPLVKFSLVALRSYVSPRFSLKLLHYAFRLDDKAND